ncbi:hypothetical protein U1Q18_038970 [Sarracenia purpurea var. burkii]
MNSLVEGKLDPAIVRARQQLPQASTSAAAVATQGQPAPQAPVPKAPTPAASTPQPSQPDQTQPPAATPPKPQVSAPSSVQKEDSAKGIDGGWWLAGVNRGGVGGLDRAGVWLRLRLRLRCDDRMRGGERMRSDDGVMGSRLGDGLLLLPSGLRRRGDEESSLLRLS